MCSTRYQTLWTDKNLARNYSTTKLVKRWALTSAHSWLLKFFSIIYLFICFAQVQFFILFIYKLFRPLGPQYGATPPPQPRPKLPLFPHDIIYNVKNVTKLATILMTMTLGRYGVKYALPYGAHWWLHAKPLHAAIGQVLTLYCLSGCHPNLSSS